jgi:hypothetical protein
MHCLGIGPRKLELRDAGVVVLIYSNDYSVGIVTRRIMLVGTR